MRLQRMIMHAQSPRPGAAPAAEPREQRRAAILALLRQGPVHNQAQLRALLAREGFRADQATLSRDLRDMGVVKAPDGYRLPEAAAPTPPEPADAVTALYRAARSWLQSAAVAGNQVVLRTPVGAASPLALALDRAGWKDVLGTIAGDDTVLVIVRTPRGAARIARELLALKEGARR